MMDSVIEFDNVIKRFPVPGSADNEADFRALQRLTFCVAESEVVGLVGPSGCGKSTTLRLVAGLSLPDEGRVLVNGKEVEKPSPAISFMLQKDLLMPWKTVLENAELGLVIRKIPKAERRKRALSLLTKYGLSNFVEYRAHQLSGGMRQRVALARTMAVNPKILLLDEPFAAVDFQTKLILQQDLLTIFRETRMTVLYITHDIGEALCLCNRVIVMSRRPGRVKAEHVVSIPPMLSLIEKRNHPSFNEQFQTIWENLDFDIGTETSSVK